MIIRRYGGAPDSRMALMLMKHLPAQIEAGMIGESCLARRHGVDVGSHSKGAARERTPPGPHPLTLLRVALADPPQYRDQRAVRARVGPLPDSSAARWASPSGPHRRLGREAEA